MSARGSDGVTFAERAAEEARSRLSRLGGRDAATVIVSGPAPELVAGPRGRPEAALAAVEAYLGEPGVPGTPCAETDELDRALVVALELASVEGVVVALTDTPRPPDLVPSRVEFVAVGESRPNVALVAADRSFPPTGRAPDERAFVAVRNLGASPASCKVVFEREGPGEAGAPRRVAVEIAPDATVPVALPVAAARGDDPLRDTLTVRIEVPDEANALALDDTATLLPPRLPTVRVANRLGEAGREAVERALSCLRGVGRSGAAPALVFCRTETEVVPRGAWRVVFSARGESKRLGGPYVLARGRATFEDVSLAGVLWAVGEERPLSAGAAPLVACANRVLAYELARHGGRPASPAEGSPALPADRRTFVFDIDLARSNLPSTPAWPVLVGNIVELRRRREPGIEKRNLAVGETARVRLPRVKGVVDEGAADAEAQRAFEIALRSAGRAGAPDRSVLPGAGLVRAFPARTLGTGNVLKDGEVFDAFCVNFLAPGESDLRALGAGHEAARDPGEPVGGRRPERRGWLVPLLCAVALAAALGDWYVLRRQRAPVTGGPSGGEAGKEGD
jgi:hypothetical protein